MRDKEIIDRLEMAYKVYKEQQSKSSDIEKFIDWLYTQYGIEKKKKD